MISIHNAEKYIQQTNLDREIAMQFLEIKKDMLIEKRAQFIEVYNMAQKALTICGEKVAIKPIYNKANNQYSFTYFCTVGNRYNTIGIQSRSYKAMLESVKQYLELEYSHYL